MPCKFPEHHGSDSGPGMLIPLMVAVGAVVLCASIITTIIHILSIVITFVGIAALAAGGGWLWWRLTHRQLPAAQQTQITQQRTRMGRQLPYQQQPEALEQGGMHLHLHGTDAAEFLQRWTDGRR